MRNLNGCIFRQRLLNRCRNGIEVGEEFVGAKRQARIGRRGGNPRRFKTGILAVRFRHAESLILVRQTSTKN